MAQIDTSIYSNQQAPDIAGGIMNGIRLSDMVRQRKLADQDMQYQQTLKNSFVPDPATGQLKFDPSRLSSLAQINPQKAYELQTQMRNDQIAQQKQKLEEYTSKANLGAQMLGGITDEQSYQAAKPKLIEHGIFEPNELPDQYDPSYIKARQLQALSVKDRLDQHWKEKEDQYKTLDETRKDSDEVRKDKELNFKQQNLDLERGKRSDAKQATYLNQTQQMLESARGNPEVMQALKDRLAANKLNSLLGDDPNKLSPQMVQLAASEVAKIAQGGVPQSAELQHLTPNSIPGDFAKAAQYFTNSPTAANQGEFLKQYQKYSNDLSDVANNVIKDKYSRVLEGKKRVLNKDDYDTLKSQYLDPFSKQSSKAPAAAGVQMRAPDGSVRLIPADQVEAAKAAGGKPL